MRAKLKRVEQEVAESGAGTYRLLNATQGPQILAVCCACNRDRADKTSRKCGEDAHKATIPPYLGPKEHGAEQSFPELFAGIL